jgi:hypothetical protein
MSLATHEDWEIHQVDVVEAYLCGDLDEDIFMEVPEGVKENGKKDWFWKLKKSLYGLKQSGWQWKKKLDEVIKELGFEKANADECLYILQKDDKIILLVLVYIDDMALAFKSGLPI